MERSRCSTKMFYLYLILLGFIVGESLITANARIINTKQGKIQGADFLSRYGRPYNSFYGIPYAKPPIRRLRFMPPVPAGSWRGILNGTQPAEQCPQVNRAASALIGNENCLFVDVHAPEFVRPGSNLPVMVYIFGGGYTAGNTTREGPQYWMDRDIVIVMVSYRLSVFGFLSTVDDVIPGNMGLKDQTEALRWTRENIYEYGGDPNRVLIAGHSSGSACVHLHTLSPLSKGLFHRAVMLSGLGNGPHLFMDPDVAKDLANFLAEKLECPTESSLFLPCVQNKTAEEIMSVAERMLRVWHQIPTAIFRPTIENPKNPGSFLIDYPHRGNYASTDVPWIIGITSGEGAFYVNEYFSRLDGLDLYDNLMLPLFGMNLWTTKPAHLNFVSQVLQSHFFGEDKLGPDTDVAFSDLLTGIMHGLGLVEVLNAYNGTKYVYLYDYRAKYSYQLSVGPYARYLGVGHADGLGLIFKEGADPLFSLADFDFGNELITKWHNFAASGNPNTPYPLRTWLISEWEPMSSERMEFLHLKVNGTMERDYFKEKFQFWRKLPIYSKFLS